MNQITVGIPYDIIVQQQVDIIASRQKAILEGKEGVTDDDLHNAIAHLHDIRNCTTNQPPSSSSIFGHSLALGAYGKIKDKLKSFDEM